MGFDKVLDNTVVVDVETTGLSPYESRITCISTCLNGEVRSFMCESEKEMLFAFWGYISSQKIERIASYNDSFDISFLQVRSLINSVRIKRFDRWNGYVDLMKLAVLGNSVKFIKQQEFCKLLGFNECKNHLTGKDMPALWEAGKYKEILEHCEDDVFHAWKIYVRFKDCGFI
jgi:predicted PolB exonuclease-like 3'-5' exonuclease